MHLSLIYDMRNNFGVRFPQPVVVSVFFVLGCLVVAVLAEQFDVGQFFRRT